MNKYLDNGKRGHHTSRRMVNIFNFYYLLSLCIFIVKFNNYIN